MVKNQYIKKSHGEAGTIVEWVRASALSCSERWSQVGIPPWRNGELSITHIDGYIVTIKDNDENNNCVYMSCNECNTRKKSSRHGANMNK